MDFSLFYTHLNNLFYIQRKKYHVRTAAQAYIKVRAQRNAEHGAFCSTVK
jgi:hypothetical protein